MLKSKKSKCNHFSIHPRIKHSIHLNFTCIWFLQVGYVENNVEDNKMLDKQKAFQDSRLKVGFPETIFNMLFDMSLKCVCESKKYRPLMEKVSIVI